MQSPSKTYHAFLYLNISLFYKDIDVEERIMGAIDENLILVYKFFKTIFLLAISQMPKFITTVFFNFLLTIAQYSDYFLVCFFI